MFIRTTRPVANRCWSHPERGQATLVLVGVVALAVVAIVLLSVFGQAIIHRARARNAADAIALAAASEMTMGAELHQWYGQQHIAVDYDETQAIARSGPSQAAAWASSQPSRATPTPALVAIVARAEQLLESDFSSIQWHATAITMRAGDATTFRTVAADLGLCEQPAQLPTSGVFDFHLC